MLNLSEKFIELLCSDGILNYLLVEMFGLEGTDARDFIQFFTVVFIFAWIFFQYNFFTKSKLFTLPLFASLNLSGVGFSH